MEQIKLWIDIATDIFTLLASGIAIYIFFFKKDVINSTLSFILNYSNQLSLTDLKYRIERLNDYNVSDAAQRIEVINILHEIQGQILGNAFLKDNLTEQLTKIAGFIDNTKTITEPRKRSIVSELRESVRNLNVSNYIKIF